MELLPGNDGSVLDSIVAPLLLALIVNDPVGLSMIDPQFVRDAQRHFL
jgi:hypothetical protein